jgi:ABC-type transporter Mla subunit MlaD
MPPRRAEQILEVVCVLVVLLAVAALVAWIVTNSGGGVLNQG